MMSARQRLLFVELAAIGAPLALVYLGRTLLATPAPMATTVPVSAPALAPPPAVLAKPLTPEQHKAAEWVRQLPPTLAAASPLNHPVEIVVATKKDPVIETVPTLPPPPPRESPIRGLKLTGVLGNEDGQLAAINGKIFRIGQDVRPGLKLTAIDARRSVITLTGSDGEIFELKREEKDLTR